MNYTKEVSDPNRLILLTGATGYYFVHSMGASEGFEKLDRRAARNFGEAARDAGVKRIIYLGGLVFRWAG